MMRRCFLSIAVLALAHAASAQTISTMDPTTATAGSGPITLTLTGQFLPGYVPTVYWLPAGSDVAVALNVTSAGATQIVATIPANLLTQPETAQVYITQSESYSNYETFTVTPPPPTLSSLSPNAALAGSASFVLTVNGANFPAPDPYNPYYVTWNGTTLTTTYVSSGQLTATVPASLLTTPGTASVTLNTTPAPQPLIFTITAPTLVLSSISPPSATAGGAGFSLTVNGSGFYSNTQVTWNGSALSTAYVSPLQLTATVPASLIASPGSASVGLSSIYQPSPSPLTFTITPNPAISSISPASATAGGAAFTLTVNGSGFGTGVIVYWNSTALTTTVVNSGQLTASVPASLIAQAGSASITAAFGSLVSNAATFTINPAPLTLTSISPSSATAGGSGFTLTANGSGFSRTTVVTWNGSALATTFVSATQLTASVPASLIAQAGTASVGVASPGQTSPAPLSFTIAQNISITSVSPATATAGGPAFTLTVNGAGFDSSTTLFWNSTVLTLTSVTASQLQATVPALLIAQPGSASITAQARGLTSNAAAFTITAVPVTLTSISPNTVASGSAGFTLTANGTGFVSGATITWKGQALTTNFLSASQLTASVPANLVATAGTASVGVTVPGQVSPSPLTFTVTLSLTLTNLSPSSATTGGPSFTLTVNGSGFISGTNVLWNGAALSTTVVNATQMTATVPANLIAQQGTASITAQCGNVTSNALSFSINTSQPITLTSLSPTSVAAGSPGFTLTVNGSGFIGGALTANTGTIITWNGTPLATTFVSKTQLTAVIPSNFLTVPETVAVSVTGSPVPASLPFTITGPLSLTSISPAKVIAGGPGFTLTANGTGFTNTTAVTWNGAPLTTAFISPTQLAAAVPANLIATPGTASVDVTAPANQSAPAALQLTISANPILTSLAPASAAAGGPAFTLTVNGTGFYPGAVVQWNGAALTTSYVSPTQLTAAVSAALIAQTGSASVTATVANVVSNALTFTIGTPSPVITSIAPPNVTAGSPAVTLTVNGTGFATGAVVSINGTPLITTFVSATQVTASIPAASIAQPGTAQITLTNPNGATSNAVALVIAQAGPTITSLSPATVVAGGPALTLTVNGTGFVQGSTVSFGSTSLITTFVSGTQLTAAVAANLVATGETISVTVTNNGTVKSNAVNFTITNPTPTVTTITPSSLPIGTGPTTITINGTNFVPGVVVSLNGTALTTTFVSPTQLTAVVPANLVPQTGSVQITVTNPGTPPSTVFTLPITNVTPALTSISPASVPPGGPAFTLTVNGANFVSGATVSIGTTSLATTFVSSTLLTAVVPANLVQQQATLQVTVANPGTGPSNALTLTVQPSGKTITSISPSSIIAGSPELTLTINGTGFQAGDSVFFNGAVVSATFVSSTQILATIPAQLIAQPGTAAVSVAGLSGQSNTVNVTITPAAGAPTLTSLSPSSANAGDPAFTLTITGTGFTSTAVVNFGSNALATTAVSATQLTAAVPANLLLTPGTILISVQQGGTTSNSETFTIALPAPPSLRLNPPTTTGPAQQPTIDFGLNSGYPLTLNGTVTITFAPNATVPVDDPSIQFATGGRSFTFTVPPNTTALPALMIQTGTVAGVITLNVTLTAAGVNVTPSSGAAATITIAKAVPVIQKVNLVHANGYLEVDITGFSTTRDMTTAVFQLNAAPGASFTSSTITVPVSSMFSGWYQSTASGAFGSQFTYAQPFTVVGDTNQISSVTVTLTNSAGSATH